MLAWALVLTLSMPVAWWGWQLKKHYDTRREARRLSAALQVSHAVFKAVEQIPSSIISRDLRRGLVLLVVHHLEILRKLNPMHPHIGDLERRLSNLNRMPSSLTASPIRNRRERQLAARALEELSDILRTAPRQNALEQKMADLARAAAVVSSQHIAVESARQAAKDAENMRAYPTALNLAIKAQALCRSLPPLAGKSLMASVARDIERLENKIQAA